MLGRVAAFDEHAGLGTLIADDGSEYRFHCIEIADGSRSIPDGTRVEFVLLPKLGRYEAASVTRLNL